MYVYSQRHENAPEFKRYNWGSTLTRFLWKLTSLGLPEIGISSIIGELLGLFDIPLAIDTKRPVIFLASMAVCSDNILIVCLVISPSGFVLVVWLPHVMRVCLFTSQDFFN